MKNYWNLFTNFVLLHCCRLYFVWFVNQKTSNHRLLRPWHWLDHTHTHTITLINLNFICEISMWNIVLYRSSKFIVVFCVFTCVKYYLHTIIQTSPSSFSFIWKSSFGERKQKESEQRREKFVCASTAVCWTIVTFWRQFFKTKVIWMGIES